MRDFDLSAEDRELVETAANYRERAYAPVSKYRVGAALRAEDGRVFGGCNVENAVLPLTCCAEQVAVFHGVAEGARGFSTVAISTESSPPAAPCGSCRQILRSWKVKRVIMVNDEGEQRVSNMGTLLPRVFSLD